jgi:Holliday junction resolvase
VPNKNYQKGRRFEYRVKKFFEKENKLVMRTAGSHSPFDLIAMTVNHTYLIQCKSYEKPTKKDIEKLNYWSKELMADFNYTTCMIVYPSGRSLAIWWGISK